MAAFGAANIVAGRAVLVAQGSIGADNRRLATRIDSIQSVSRDLGTYLYNDGNLTASLDPNAPAGTAMMAGTEIYVSASSPFTAAAGIAAGSGDVVIVANESAAEDVDTITVEAGVTVEALDGNIALYAGDHVIVAETATVRASGNISVFTDVATELGTGALGTAAPTLVVDAARVDAQGGDVEIAGLVDAGGALRIDTGATGPNGLAGAVDQRDTVLITGALVAGDRIDIMTGGDKDIVRLQGLTVTTPVLHVAGEAGRDLLVIKDPTDLSAKVTLSGGAQEDRIEVTRLDAQGQNDSLLIDGGMHADDIVIQTWGSMSGAAAQIDYEIDVADSGGIGPDAGADRMDIRGTSENDAFLSRAGFAALMHGTEAQIRGIDPGRPDTVERVNYDRSLNGRLGLIGLDGDDLFISDDNSTIVTMDGGLGDDTFQFGQMFGSEPVAGGSFIDPDTDATVSNGIAPGDGIETIETTRGFLSRGLSYATTAFGGEGADLFTVYSNKGELRMEGENGNDTFVVRAFLLAGADLAVDQGLVKVRAGDGDDNVRYNINAPVDIDGGAGFDTVVALGTEGDDTFVFNEDGIFGSGLNITLSNVEEAIEVDGLEGDDTFFIQSTAANTVTNIIGGLGSDTFNVAGDVTERIYSADLDGRSGSIEHVSDSGDSDYQDIAVPGLGTTIADGNIGKVVIENTGSDTTVAEGGMTDSYTMRLAEAPEAGQTVYVTVSAGIASRQDRRLDVPTMAAGTEVAITGNQITRTTGSWFADGFHDAQVLSLTGAGDNTGAYAIDTISADGRTITVETGFAEDVAPTTEIAVSGQQAATVEMRANGAGGFTDGLVLAFDASNWNSVQTVDIRAIDDAAAEGERNVLISHAVDSGDAAFDGVAVANQEVTVLDNDKVELRIRESGADTFVHEGDATTRITDTYTVELARRPEVGETVTVTIGDTSNSGDLQFSSNVLTFNHGNWDSPQTVTITATPDDSTSADPEARTERVDIVHTMSSDGAIYADVADQSLTATVSDGDSAGVIMRETDGNTLLIDSEDDSLDTTDDYTLRLSSVPDAPVTISIVDDGQSQVRPSATVTLANLSGISLRLQSVAGGPHTIERLDGGSFIADGLRAGATVTVGGASDAANNGLFDVAELSAGGSTLILSDAAEVVTEDVAAADLLAEDQRVRLVTIAEASNIPIRFIAVADGPDRIERTDGGSFLDDGFRAGARVDVSGSGSFANSGTFGIAGISDDGSALILPAAIAIENENISDASLTVEVGQVVFDQTNWWQEVSVELEPDPDFEPSQLDNVTKTFPTEEHATSKIRGPLILDGGATSERELFSAVMLPAESDPGPKDIQSVTDEAVQTDRVNIFNDESGINDTGRMHNTPDGRTLIDGLGMGTGTVTFSQGEGMPDLTYDSGISISTMEIIELMLGQGDDTFTIDGTNVSSDYDNPAEGVVNRPITVIHGGGGADTLIANEISEPAVGAASLLVLYGDTDTDGARYDYRGGVPNGNARIFNAVDFRGDHGDLIDASAIDFGDPTRLGVVAYGGIGDDTILGSQATDHLAGGGGDDVIEGGAGNDHVYSDNGFRLDPVTRDLTVAADIDATPRFTSADTRAPGADTLRGGDGDDILLGDTGIITQLAGTNRIETTGALARIETVLHAAGGDDVIEAGAGNDIAFGGAADDTLVMAEGNNIGFGDGGVIDWIVDDGDAGAIDLIKSLAPAIGGDDTLSSGTGADILIGGAGSDRITSSGGRDVLFGDNALLNGYGTAPLAAAGGALINLGRAQTLAPQVGARDEIRTGAGAAIVFGGAGGGS